MGERDKCYQKHLKGPNTELMRTYILTGADQETVIFPLWQKSVSSQCTRMECKNETHFINSVGSHPELSILSGSSGQREMIKVSRSEICLCSPKLEESSKERRAERF